MVSIVGPYPMLRPEQFSSLPKFSKKNILEDRACWKSVILRLVWTRLDFGKEMAPQNKTRISTEEGEITSSLVPEEHLATLCRQRSVGASLRPAPELLGPIYDSICQLREINQLVDRF
jgi:hypothetical protein